MPWRSAVFFLARNEWDVLSAKVNAVVHLWCIATRPPVLAAVPISRLVPHVATDQGSGRWQVLACPFRDWAPTAPAV